MRLSPEQVRIIRSSVESCDPEAKIFLFGSRVNDQAKGGDIDLLCLSSQIDRQKRRRIRREMSDRMGGRKVDLIVASDETSPFTRLALEDGVRLSSDS